MQLRKNNNSFAPLQEALEEEENETNQNIQFWYQVGTGNNVRAGPEQL
jgi:hypothetical protein